MKGVLYLSSFKRCLNVAFAHRYGTRTILTKAYRCEDEWLQRLQSPLLTNIKMDHYFIETDKKFNTKRSASGIDIDLFAISVQDASQLEELEHLLYRFGRSKRSVEMMDSTICATIRVFLKCKDYESLFRILENQESYRIFPDFYLYNILMDSFIKENMFKEATRVAILMMLQEDFSNEISCILAWYSCQMFLKKCPVDSLFPQEVVEEKDNEGKGEDEDEDEEEETLERVHFLRNPWFDDHFMLKKPEHLIGKTLYLTGRQMQKDILGRTYQLLGLALYEKWDLALELLISLVDSGEAPVLLSGGVEEFKKHIDSVPDEDKKGQFNDLLKKLQDTNKLKPGDLEEHLNLKLKDFPVLEDKDIQIQKDLFKEWERKRELALKKQNLELDKEQRLEVIAKKKEYLYWKEKMLFFFENEYKNLAEFQKAEEITALLQTEKSREDSYLPPEIVKKPQVELTKYQKLALVKIL